MLDVQDLSIAWKGKTVVHHVSFTVQTGETLAIVGASGSGKSTILAAILGLPSEARAVTGGRILLDGRDLLQLPARERRSLAGTAIAMVFQDAGASLCPVRRIGDELLDGLRGKGWTKRDLRVHATPLLERLHLKDSVLDAYPFELSGGMAARVGILAALLSEPRVLLADEPTAALDTVTQADVAQEFRALCRAQGTALVLVTHHMGLAHYMADHVLVLQGGVAIEQGTCQDVFTHPEHAYTQELIAAVPRIGGGDCLGG